MNKQVLNDDTVVYYALAVNGRVVTPKVTEKFAAEMARASLPAHQQKIAELVTVDASGRQLLLG
jgi:hypothetical protein